MKRAWFAIALLAAGIGVPTAQADGLPVLGVDAGPAGVAPPGSDVRYVTFPAGRDTIVARVERDGGRVLGSRLLRGTFSVPAVAYDGSADGLSADGRTLVLIQPRTRFPRARTVFAVLDAERLRLQEVITLRGDFSFDALSPSGSSLFLIEYISPRDPTRYQVRVFDLAAGRLLPEPIVDARVADEVMRGSPITRVASADGRWAYTLYDGAGKHPFIHALDTVEREARCIDLHALMGRDVSDLRLGLRDGGRSLAVLAAGEPLALVDTRTFAVREPRPPAAEGVRERPTEIREAAGDRPWALVAGALFALAAAGLSAKLLLLRRRAPRLEGELNRALNGSRSPDPLLVSLVRAGGGDRKGEEAPAGEEALVSSGDGR